MRLIRRRICGGNQTSQGFAVSGDHHFAAFCCRGDQICQVIFRLVNVHFVNHVDHILGRCHDPVNEKPARVSDVGWLRAGYPQRLLRHFVAAGQSLLPQGRGAQEAAHAHRFHGAARDEHQGAFLLQSFIQHVHRAQV
jgi:hypothetical protein